MILLPRNETPLAEAAAIYAAAGWRIFPLNGKLPAIRGGKGFHDASSDADQVREWWQRWPNANIGLPMGDRNWFTLDVDAGKDGIATRVQLEREHGPLPFTLRAATGGGGEHWIFTAPNAAELVNRANVAGGLDVRTTGGYIAIAPSVHPVTGALYEWEIALDPVPAPAWLLALLPHKKQPEPVRYVPLPDSRFDASKRERYAMAALRNLAREVAESGKGQRNDALNRAWFRMAQFRDVITQSQAREVLRAAGLSCGLDDREVAQVLR
jgi:hypothetical protein